MAEIFEEIPSFLRDLEDATKKKGGSNFSKDLKVINMRSNKNWGKAIIVPIDGPNKSESAIKQLNRVAHVEKWVEGIKQDGTPYGFVQRLYFFLDPKYYGDLAEEQLAQLERIRSKFNQVNSSGHPGVGLHQLTLIQGLALSHKDKSTPVKEIYQNIPALYIFESKNFEKSFRKTLTDMSDKLKGYSWLYEMCNREPLRKRYIQAEFYLNKDEGAGFQVTSSLGKFDEDATDLTGGTIGLDLSKVEGGFDEFIKKFGDPVKTWLQLPQDGPRFDESYINEIEVILNNNIKGESTVDKRELKQGEPSVPDSNAGFVEQSETQSIPTAVEAKQIEPDTNDKPF